MLLAFLLVCSSSWSYLFFVCALCKYPVPNVLRVHAYKNNYSNNNNKRHDTAKKTEREREANKNWAGQMFPQQAASSKITPRMISSLGPAPSAVPPLILLPPAVFYVRSYFLVRLNRLVEHCPPAALSTKSADYFLFPFPFPFVYCPHLAGIKKSLSGA